MNQNVSGSPSAHQLPVIADCRGCGVCCLHMGYPAFILPREPMTDRELDTDPQRARQLKQNPRLRKSLRDGHPGEPNWHTLPSELKTEWTSYVAQYSLPEYGDTPDSFDGPCIWFDMETRQCKHHEHRPRVCRDFETGSPECLQWRSHYEDKILLNRPAEN